MTEGRKNVVCPDLSPLFDLIDIEENFLNYFNATMATNRRLLEEKPLEAIFRFRIVFLLGCIRNPNWQIEDEFSPVEEDRNENRTFEPSEQRHHLNVV